MHDSKSNGAGPVEPPAFPGDHAQGRAALLLAESLMHALVAKGIISREVFVEIVEGAAEVEREFVQSNGSYLLNGTGRFYPRSQPRSKGNSTRNSLA